MGLAEGETLDTGLDTLKSVHCWRGPCDRKEAYQGLLLEKNSSAADGSRQARGVCSSLLGGKRREEADGSVAAADTARGLRR